MNLSRTSRNLTIGIGLWGALGPADHAWAYKVTTHEVVAIRGAERLPEGDLQNLLLGNEQSDGRLSDTSGPCCDNRAA